MQYYWTHGFLLDNMFVALVCRWRRQVMSLFMYDVVLFLIQLSVDWCKVELGAPGLSFLYNGTLCCGCPRCMGIALQ